MTSMPMPSCVAAARSSGKPEESRRAQICIQYRAAMRQSHVCPKCHFNRVLFVAEVPDADGQYRYQIAAAAIAVSSTGIFGNDKLGPVGALSSCICRRCGYTELYTVGFEHIPVDGRYVQELVGPEPEPYR